jgi:hypothetical protein
MGVRDSGRAQRQGQFAVGAVAMLIALASVRPYAGSWNDGSRLATVEALVDQHTLAIDDSIFVRVPMERPPYPPHLADLREHGTQDKMFIRGHYYSDKSPVPALLLAVVYWLGQHLGGLTAATHPAAFCYLMGLASAGLAYVVAVLAIHLLGSRLGLTGVARYALTAGFGLATLAAVYLHHVNNHILLLAVAATMLPLLNQQAEHAGRGEGSLGRLLGLGTLAGLGYSIDLATGPLLLVSVFCLVVYRTGRPGLVFWFVLAALPGLVLHHGVNYAVGGAWRPANAVPEHFEYAGSAFQAQDLTGGCNHAGPGPFLVYALALLMGKNGFLSLNLPLLLAVPALVGLLRRRVRCGPELLALSLWAVGTWLSYSLFSPNYSGRCCSIRWFLPLLAPGFYVLAVCLRSYPETLWDYLILSGLGGMVAALGWWSGPWQRHPVAGYWPLLIALVAWGTYRWQAQGSWGRLSIGRPIRPIENRPHEAASYRASA